MTHLKITVKSGIATAKTDPDLATEKASAAVAGAANKVVEKTGQAAQRTKEGAGKAVEQAVDKAVDKASDASRRVGEKLEKAGRDLKKNSG